MISQTGATPNVYLYSGEQNDANLGFYYLRARSMNTPTGRFWNADPFEGSTDSPLSLHRYLYASGDPVNRIDPSGNVTLTDVVATLAVNNILASVLLGSYNGYRLRGVRSFNDVPFHVSVQV